MQLQTELSGCAKLFNTIHGDVRAGQEACGISLSKEAALDAKESRRRVRPCLQATVVIVLHVLLEGWICFPRVGAVIASHNFVVVAKPPSSLKLKDRRGKMYC
jgi:hypothetical protein